MTRFITLPSPGSEAHAALWNETEDGLIELVSIHRDIQEVQGHEEIDTYRFEVPTTFDTSSATNEGSYPVADADGKPLWAGCRIEFNLPDHYINTVMGAGELQKVDVWRSLFHQ